MEFSLRKHPHLVQFLFALLIGVFFCYPYLFSNFLYIGHDNFYHLSRIEGLAHSFQDGTLIPAIYPYKNDNFGYASPLFYSDFFLMIPAFFYQFGLPLSTSYKLVIFVCTVFTCYSMASFIYLITKIGLML